MFSSYSAFTARRNEMERCLVELGVDILFICFYNVFTLAKFE